VPLLAVAAAALLPVALALVADAAVLLAFAAASLVPVAPASVADAAVLLAVAALAAVAVAPGLVAVAVALQAVALASWTVAVAPALVAVAPALVAVPPASRAVAAALGLQPQHVESQHFNNKPPENPTLLLLPMSTKKCDKEMGQAGKRKDMVENRCVNCKKHKNCNKRQELPDHNKLSGLPTATIARLNAIFGSGMTGVC
jgi:hypothetical protein